MKKKIAIFVPCIILIILITVGLLFYTGTIWFNNPSRDDYPIRGVDVSKYQGNIDWDVLSSEDIQFAYIKATEGSTYVDGFWEINYKNALGTGLRIGAYHFFSFESDGLTQADNFISAVPKNDELLPPVVDFEFYRDYEKNPPDVNKTRKNLNELLLKLEQYYGVKPVIYATEKSYKTYLCNTYNHYDIWIRSIFTKPELPDGRQWTFWQYSSRETLKGYSGEEKFIDMNVFNGTAEEFSNYGK